MTPADALVMPSEPLIRDDVSPHLAHLRLRNLRPLTIYQRHRALVRFAWQIGKPLLTATADDVRAWQDRRAVELTAGARAAEFSNVREFYRWALRQGLITSDPTVDLPMPRVPRRLPRPIRDEALTRAFASADQRMTAVLSLAAFAGLRACEIARLQWPEVALHDDPPTLLVLDGKGGRQRVVPLAEPLRLALLRLGSHRGYVIRRGDGGAGPNQPHRISGLANTYLHGCGIPDSLHTLRHRAATAWYRSSNDLRVVQELCGHASPTTTAGYAAYSQRGALAAVQGGGVLLPS